MSARRWREVRVDVERSDTVANLVEEMEPRYTDWRIGSFTHGVFCVEDRFLGAEPMPKMFFGLPFRGFPTVARGVTPMLLGRFAIHEKFATAIFGGFLLALPSLGLQVACAWLSNRGRSLRRD